MPQQKNSMTQMFVHDPYVGNHWSRLLPKYDIISIKYIYIYTNLYIQIYIFIQIS